MERTDFDSYSANYHEKVADSISFSGLKQDFFTKAKAETLIEVAAARLGDLSAVKMLDVGCGVGETDRLLYEKVRELHGVDISAASIERAKANNPTVHYQSYSGEKLPFADDSFDACFAINIMHHVPPKDWANFVAEMRRVTRPGGLLMVFEHNPFNPLTRLAVFKCEFDKDANLLRPGRTRELFAQAGLREGRTRFILFFPFKSKITRLIERVIAWLPMGAQYCATAKK